MLAWVLRIAISLAALAGLVARLVWPDLRIDAVSLGLLVLIALPWLAPIFESVEFPGGWKFAYRNLRDAASEIPEPSRGVVSSSTAEPSYLTVRGLDPQLALVGLRIEIEKRLQALAAQSDLLTTGPTSAGSIARRLSRAGVLPPEVAGALTEIISAANVAAHGEQLPESLESFAFDEGPRILAWLDEQIDPSRGE